MKSITSKILLLLLVVFIVIQFFGPDKSVPAFDQSKDFIVNHQPPVDVEYILRNACYDCHSYETGYPWYSNVEPLSWWLQGHIDHARDEMNMSLWADYSHGDADHLLEEIVEVVDEEEMPLPSYTWVHSDARLTDEERNTLTEWVGELRVSLQESPADTSGSNSMN